jgi:hypothetical protein
LEQGSTQELKKIDLEFIAQDWRGLGYLKVIATGIPGNNEIGPHLLPSGTYNIQVYKYIDTYLVKAVGVDMIVDRSNGLITMYKSASVPAFSGRIVIDYAPI